VNLLVRCFKRFIAKLWLGGVALLILIALFVSAIRAALPQFNQYQQQFSQYLMENHQVHFSMAQVQAHWQDGGPTVTLTQPVFSNLERFGVEFSAQKLAFQFNISQSILALSPRINWLELEQGNLTIGQLPASADEGTDNVGLLMNLVAKAHADDIVISFDDTYGTLPPVHLSQLKWLGGAEQRQIQLSVAAEKSTEPPLSMLVNLSGEDRESLQGHVYINAINWHWMDDLAAFLPTLTDDVNAETSFELWADFSASSVASMVFKLGDNQLSWLSSAESQHLSILPSTVSWQPHHEGWDAVANKLQLVFNQQDLMPINFSLSSAGDTLSGHINQIDLAPLASLSAIFSSVSDDTSQLFNALSPQGHLANIAFKRVAQQWHYHGELADYNQQQVGGIPAISGLTGVFSGLDNAGQANIRFGQDKLDFGPYFKQPIAIDTLHSSVYWGGDTNRSWFGASRLSVSNNDLSSELALQLLFEPASSPVLSLYGEAQLNSAKEVDKYLPHVVMSDGLVSYLSAAIIDGRSEKVGLLWQGELNQFPYSDNNGVFEVNARVTNATYQFHQDWLALTDASVDLSFHNESMLITGISGQLKNLNFESLTTRIDDLLIEPKVVVDVELNQPQSKINDFVFSSVIDGSVGAVLRALAVKGNVRTKLHIDIPLDDSMPVVSGKVLLNNNDIEINAIDLAVNQVSGELSFINGDVIGSNIRGELYQQPITFDINTKPIDAELYGIVLDLNAKWHSDNIPDSWHTYLDDYLSGVLDWQGQVTLEIGEQGVSYKANVKSPMQGLALKLPKPLDKYIDHQEALRISTSGDSQGGQFNLSLGSRAEVLADFSTSDKGVDIGQLSLMVGRGFNPQDIIAKDGLSLKIDLETLQLDEWQSFISSIEQGHSQDSFFPALNHIEAKVKQLTVLDQILSDVQLSGAKREDSWHIAVNSQQAIGTVEWYDDLEQRGITARFQRLELAKHDKSKQASKPIATLAALQNLPSLDFTCTSCQIGGIELGELSFNTQRDEQGILIDNIIVNQSDTNLVGQALWGFDQHGEFTKVSGNIVSDNLEATLQLFDLTSGIKDSGLKSTFDISWRSSLYQPDIASLDGQINWTLSEGHIAEVSDNGARIFSLFSLDSLRRKLVLDFRDVFVKGIFYNDFKGDFTVENGVAVTRNAHMDGVAGGIDVIGSVNLDTTELDYYITFSPKLFSNIPVIAGVVTSTPQVFVLAFALTKVLEPIIDVISQVNFKLTGNVTDPQFVEINRKQKKYKVPDHILPKPQVALPTQLSDSNDPIKAPI